MVANIVLFSWPLVAVILFKNMRVEIAALAVIVGGYLLLPTRTELDLPLLPALDKNSIPALCVFVALLILAKAPGLQPGWWPKKKLPILLILLLIGGGMLTMATNRESLPIGPQYLPGLRAKDGFSMVLVILMSILPLLIGRRLFARPEQQRILLIALVMFGLGYSLLALYEVRMSPQLNRMIYGFFPGSWTQQVRGDGFRPIVFLNHGLWVSIFFSLAVLAAFGLVRVSSTGLHRLFFFCAGLWLFMTLILSKSLGALGITLLLSGVIWLLGRRLQFLAVALLAFSVLTYPTLRGADLVPVDKFLAWAADIDARRGQSLEFRFQNESALLEKARQKPVFGWGGWGRGNIYDELGRNISIFDGYWIIVFSVGGWVRYLAVFGLLCLPVIFSAFQARRFRLEPETAIVAIVLVANLIDLIPNGTMTSITAILAGALWGRLELGRLDEPAPVPLETAAPKRKLTYNRQPISTAPVEPSLRDMAGNRQSEPPKYTRQYTRLTRQNPD